MIISYAYEAIARQRLEETARLVRNSSRRPPARTRAGWHFPKVHFPTRPHVATPKLA